ncbi:hypothetical protein [Actinosynnema pretiosum]|uniref:Co-chaperone DjlA N-terminal domain-containing protein n=1 Tax=Actinosynnema pretiosum TaxID=42197 RepID=A0A290Z8K7_9PSEU|nr:hypothetical protein [Actinosynnema pretiosum]ATE55312.1 hypothetical protein CNX65_20165 [Actinosynnema pretiosum]
MGYTDEESRTLRTAVYGAMVLVSVADEGALDKETHAGVRAMAALPDEVREAISADTPELPGGTMAEVEHGVLAALRQSFALVAYRAPQDAEAFADAVVEICREVATADGSVARAEHAAVLKVRTALSR